MNNQIFKLIITIVALLTAVALGVRSIIEAVRGIEMSQLSPELIAFLMIAFVTVLAGTYFYWKKVISKKTL
jgi:hypothetical protein